MNKELMELYLEHDKIKNSNIRLAGLIGEEVPYNAKDLYFSNLLLLVNNVKKYINQFKEEKHVLKTMEYCNLKKYNYNDMDNELHKLHSKYTELIDFIAVTDYKIFSPIHYIIEHLYFYLNGSYRTKSFEMRMK